MRGHNIEVQAKGVDYPMLRYLCGDPTSLFILAAQCHVHHVHLNFMIPRDCTPFYVVLEATRPKHRTCDVMDTHRRPREMSPMLPQFFSEYLTHLTINFDLLFSKIDMDRVLVSES